MPEGILEVLIISLEGGRLDGWAALAEPGLESKAKLRAISSAMFLKEYESRFMPMKYYPRFLSIRLGLSDATCLSKARSGLQSTVQRYSLRPKRYPGQSTVQTRSKLQAVGAVIANCHSRVAQSMEFRSTSAPTPPRVSMPQEGNRMCNPSVL